MNDEYVIETKNLMKRYPGGVTAVKDLSIEVKRGEVFGFLGPNGAGKSTALKMMVGLLKPTKGETRINGRLVKPGSRVVKEKVGVVPQEVTLWKRLTVKENLYLMGELYLVPRKRVRESTDGLLKALQLTDKRKSKVSELSGGMKRRLNVAMALIHDPEIILMDEPSPGLDPQSRLVLWDFIKSIPEKGEKTVILTTHFMEEADRLSHRVAIMDNGLLLVKDTPGELKNRMGEGDVLELEVNLEAETGPLVSRMMELPLILDVKVVDEGKIWVRAHNAVAQMPKVFSLAAECNVDFRDVKLRKNTLEDVFISLTGRGLRE